MTAAHYRNSIVLSKDDMERVRAFIMYAGLCRSLSFCAPTPRNVDGLVSVSGCTTERLTLGIDVRSMLGRFGNTRLERLRDWALGTRHFYTMPTIEQTQLRQDMIRIRNMASAGGYAHLLGLDDRVAS